MLAAMSRKYPKPPAPKSEPVAPAIISPAIDFLCCGGISILAVVAIFVYAHLSPASRLVNDGVNLILIGILGTLFNAPHFMASYHLVYRKRELITQHKLASLYVPVVLLALILFAVVPPSLNAGNHTSSVVASETLIFLSFVLLAWHYTGQAWGMTGAFAFIGGIRMENRERWLIRCGHHTLLVWHILWACRFTLQVESVITEPFVKYAPQVGFLLNAWSVVVLLTIPLGIAGFLRIRKRTGIKPPLRSYAPWVAIYLWYALIWAYPKMFPLLQIFHAMQYLIFPVRVELNHYSAQQRHSGARKLWHAIGYYLILVAIGFAVFEIPPVPAQFVALVGAFVNIHHYFIDGAIWKIRNPQVRRELFAHLPVPGLAKSAA